MKVDYVLVTSSYYKRDVLNLLFLPEGVQYRFRYREKWVPDSLLQNPSELQNKTVLIAYFFGLKDKEDPPNFFPIRVATIEEVSKLGDILYLRYLAGKIAPPDLVVNGGKALQNALRELVTPHLNARVLSKYIIPAKDLDVPPQDDQMKGWTSVVMSLGALKLFQLTNFLKFIGITDQKRRALVPKRIVGRPRRRLLRQKPGPQVFGYQLKSGQTYSADIMQRIPVESIQLSSPIDIAMESSDVIVPLGKDRIVGSYDKLELNFTVKTAFQDEYTSLLIRAGSGNGRITGDTQDSAIDSPEAVVRCKVRRSFLLFPLSLIGVGISLTSVSDWIASELSSLQVLANSATIVAITMKALGPALVAIGVGNIARKA